MEVRCAVVHTVEGMPCPNPGVVEFHGRFVCPRHATRLEATRSEDRGAYLEGVIFHLETWLERAGDEGESVRDLEAAKADATAELYMLATDFEIRVRRQVQNASVHALLAALDAYDEYTGEHSQAVVEFSSSVAREMGLSERELSEVEQAALLHDIGKIGVPDATVGKAGPLDEDEWEQIKKHPVIGARLVGSVEGLSHLVPVIRAGHERWDGWGYPDGLKGEEIPLASRIVFACDAYHAMISDRPYRRALSPQEAVVEIERNSGSQFCPATVEALLRVVGGGERAASATILGLRLVEAEGAAEDAAGPASATTVRPYGDEGEPSGGPGAGPPPDHPGKDEGYLKEALEASEERYRLLVELSPEPVAIHSGGKFIYINPAGAEMFGCTRPDDLIGRPVLDFVHPDYRDMAGERIRSITQEGARADLVEEKLLRVDGTVIDVEILGVPVVYGGAVAVQVLIRNITERKRTEKALERAESRYRSLVEQVPAVVYLDALDEVSSAIYISPQVEDMLGYAPEEWLEDPELFVKLLHPGDRDRVLAEHARANADHAPLKTCYRLLARDGRVVGVRDESLVVTFDEDGTSFRQGLLLENT